MLKNLAILLLAATIGFAFWLHERNFPLPERNLTFERRALPPQNGRRLEHVTLQSPTLGAVGFTVSLPDPLPKTRMPVVMVLGALGSGENNIRPISRIGDNVLIGYDWPLTTPFRMPQGVELLQGLPDLYRRLIVIPGQAAAMANWAAAQPWADRNRVSLLGFSLGALAVPAVQNAIQANGQVVGWSILAYGGAPLGSVFTADPYIRVEPSWLRPVIARMIDIVLHPLEPTVSLPKLAGTFLVLEGKDDDLIPADARLRLRNSVPSPKTVISFEGGHMGTGPDKNALLQKIIGASGSWLMTTGAVNPL